jgi:anti-sigma factor RsiW
MKHFNDTLAARLALGEASPEEARQAEAHVTECTRCRELLAATRAMWAVLETDPASTQPDTPLWPRVAEALDRRPGGATMPVLRPRWRIAMGEALHTPVAYAGLGLVAIALVGGHVAGRALLGSTAGTVVSDTGNGAEALDLSALLDVPSGSLAATYLDQDLTAGGEANGEEAQR